MGKCLVVPQIDASSVGLGQILFKGVYDMKNKLITYTDNRFIYYPKTSDNFSKGTIQKITGSPSYFLDLGNNAEIYAGATLYIKWGSVDKASEYIDASYPVGANWRAFASSINVSLPVSATAQNAVTIAEVIDGEDNKNTTQHLIEKSITIPQGTRYIILNPLSTVSFNDVEVKIIIT